MDMEYCSVLSLSFSAFSRLLSIAEETLAEFLSKATGTAVEWVQMPGMKVTSYCNLFFLHHFTVLTIDSFDSNK